MKQRLLALIVVAIWLGLWQLAAEMQWVSRVFLPSPLAAAQSLIAGFSSGNLARFTVGTIGRMVDGWVLACAIGMSLGAVIGISPALRAWLNPMLEVLRPLPASAMMPVFIGLLGFTPQMILAVIAFGALWPVLLSTMHGFSSIEPRLLEVSRLLGLSRRAFIFKIGLPSALPDALAGMRLALTVSLILAVVGEMLTAQPGLGRAILFAARSFKSADLFAGVMLLGLIGFSCNALLAAVERRALAWQQTR